MQPAPLSSAQHKALLAQSPAPSFRPCSGAGCTVHAQVLSVRGREAGAAWLGYSQQRSPGEGKLPAAASLWEPQKWQPGAGPSRATAWTGRTSSPSLPAQAQAGAERSR